MKKLLFITIAATALASCSTDETVGGPGADGLVEVTMATSLPDGLQTYADGASSNNVTSSAKSGLVNLEDSGLTVRYIMEAYPENSETPVDRKIVYKTLSSNVNYSTAEFKTRLVAAKYKFVFWADIVQECSTYPYESYGEDAPTPPNGLDKPYYSNRYFFSNKDESSDVLIRPTYVDTWDDTSANLTQIIPSNSLLDQQNNKYSEMYDGYTTVSDDYIDLRANPAAQTFTLKRPFAKLRIVTTDANLASDIDFSKSTVGIYSNQTTIPNTYNALTSQYSTSQGRNDVYWNNGMSYALKGNLYSDETDTSVKTLGVFYMPVPDLTPNMTLTFTLYDKTNSKLPAFSGIKVDVDNVPLKANHLTTIKGNLLSKATTATVIIDDEFDEPEQSVVEIASADDLNSALTGATQTVTYTAQVMKAEGLTLDFTNMTRAEPVYKEGNDAVLTLNLPYIEENAVLTIKGGSNAPSQIKLNTGGKCSLRMNTTDTQLYLAGSDYKYLAYNCKLSVVPPCNVEAMFLTENASFFFTDNYEEVHVFDITDAFKLASNEEGSYTLHSSPCTFYNDTLKPYFDKNPDNTIWHFVGDSNN